MRLKMLAFRTDISSIITENARRDFNISSDIVMFKSTPSTTLAFMRRKIPATIVLCSFGSDASATIVQFISKSVSDTSS